MAEPMTQKPLQALFDAMYHGRHAFTDFLEGSVTDHYTVHWIKERKVFAPDKLLKTYHSFIRLFLLDYLRTNTDVVFSYRKGTSPYDAVARHQESKVFYHTDISNFFGSLDSAIVKATIQRSASETPILDLDDHIDRLLELTMAEGSLPVGFSTSPLLSNACLYDFDNQLMEYCQAHGLILTRYSDDIIISGDDALALSGVEKAVSAILQEIFDSKLSINQKKSRFLNKGRKIKLLGMVILPNGQVSIDSKFKSNLEVLIHFYLKDQEKFIDKSRGKIEDGMTRITGYLNYVNTVDKAYLDKLRRKYGITTIDTLMRDTRER